MRLAYTDSGTSIVALARDCVHLYWEWTMTINGKSTTKVTPHIMEGAEMINDKVDGSKESFMVLCGNDFLLSTSGWAVSLYDMMTFEKATFMSPSCAPTCIAVLREHGTVFVAVGLCNSSIDVYSTNVDAVVAKLTGHAMEVTDLAFSKEHNILISGGADGQLIMWNTANWEKQKSRFSHSITTPEPKKDLHLQFYRDQAHLLVVNYAFLAVYETTELVCEKQWNVPDMSLIQHATLSCDSALIYSCFFDGTLKIFEAVNLQLLCQINSTAYIQFDRRPYYATSTAAHPQDPNQFAVGFTDGSIQVFEPLDVEGRWDLPMPVPVQSATHASTSHNMQIGTLPNEAEEHDIFERFPTPYLTMTDSDVSESTEASETEDDEDEDEDEVADDDGDDEGEEGNEDAGEENDEKDPEDQPEANGNAGSDDDDEDDDDDDDDGDDDEGEDEDEEDEEEDEEDEDIPQPPTKKRK